MRLVAQNRQPQNPIVNVARSVILFGSIDAHFVDKQIARKIHDTTVATVQPRLIIP